MNDDVKQVAHLFGTYFHQDCLVDDPDWESVVLRFRDSEPFADVRATHAALQRLLEQSDERGLEALLFGPSLLSFYDPRPERLTLRAWLEEIIHLLAGGSPRTSDRLSVSLARRKAASVARNALAGELDRVLAARELCGLRFSVGVREDDADFLCFVLIDSETDSLPLDSERSQWSAEALARLEPEIARQSEWVRKVGDSALESIVRRFAGAG